MVEFYDRIISWRKRRRRELTLLRKERSRRKLRDTAKEGDAKALLKLQSIKKVDSEKSAKYRKVKEELRERKKNGEEGKR